MMPREHIQEALAGIRTNVLRSALTAFGVTVGVASIILMGAIVEGAKASVEEQIKFLGANVLTVATDITTTMEGAARRSLLVDDDVRAISRLPNVREVSGSVMGSLKVAAGDQSRNTLVSGIDASNASIFRSDMAEGRNIDDEDVAAGAKVVVLGNGIAKRLFGDHSALDRTVRVSGVPLTIIGVRARLGRMGGAGQDEEVYVPISTARARLIRVENAPPRLIHGIAIKVDEMADMGEAQEAVDTLLRERKAVSTDDNSFEVSNPAKLVEMLNETQITFGWLLAVTAVISLIVGGAGIMNIMLVSVTERTHEIGLRKALGAREIDILTQFLIEAVMLCVGAGLVGLIIGFAGAYAAASLADWPVAIGFWMIVIALLASIGVGVIFGYVPARNAARLDPVEALARD